MQLNLDKSRIWKLIPHEYNRRAIGIENGRVGDGARIGFILGVQDFDATGQRQLRC